MIFDAVGKLSSSQRKNALKEGGIYLNVNKASGSPRAVKTEHILFIKDLIEEGKLKSTIDRQYPLEDIVEAHRYVETGHKKGHVVINVATE